LVRGIPSLPVGVEDAPWGHPNKNRIKDTRTLTETQAASGSAGSSPPDDILTRIVRTKEEEVRTLERRAEELWSAARDAPPPRDAVAALRRPGEVGLIAEVKRRSPGAGPIRPGLDPAALARSYRDAGASAISVLTDGPWFGGSLADLEAVRAAVELPVLRKDFTLVPTQVAEARASGADLVLLIVRILDPARLRELLDAARELDLTALVEVHDRGELDRAVEAGARVIGVNNRDLTRFTTDLSTTVELVPRVPSDAVLVSESGIRSPDDVVELGRAGVDAVLVGEAIVSADDPGAVAAGLSGHPREERRAPGRRERAGDR
jgi:indole-3-glycerol phosphate synthase